MEEIVVIALCLVLNGLFSCFEMAFVTVTRPQLRQLARKGLESAKHLLVQRENPERALSIIQIGITMVGMISAAVGGAGAEESFAPIIEQRFGVSENVAEGLSILIVVLPLTYLSVVLGELVPKSIALRNPIGISMHGSRWLRYADRIFSPFVSFLEWSTKSILRIFIRKAKPPPPLPQTTVEIDMLSQQAQQYVLNLVGIESKRLRDVMIPWAQVDLARSSDSIEQLGVAILSSGHTRLPVVESDRVLGILHTKEFLALTAAGETAWHSIIRPFIALKEDDLALKALKLMQERRSHMGIVFTAGNAPVGIVTFQDILEEVVGEFYDEDDDGRTRKILAATPRFRFLTRHERGPGE